MNVNARLFKYKVGLGVLGLITLGFVVFAVVQAQNSKQDAKTHEAAVEIAEKLNNYVSTNQEIPDSLDTVGASDVPSTITYRKLSDESYRFCITYKADSGSLDATSAVNQAISGYYGQSYESPEEGSSLYISYLYKEGENCQTITPVIYDSNYFDDYFNDYNFDSNTYYQ
jgi:hypothetical protein